jgi:phage baseplate assembly protein gpV
MSDFDTAENDRRIANMAQMGVVEEVDYANPPRARVRIGTLLTGWLRMGTARAGDAQASWGYSVGEEVLIVATSGDLRQGVIVCALANGTNVADADAGTFRVRLPGGVTIEIAGGAINITAPGNINVNGDVIADGISLVTHVHGGVIPGAADTDGPK